MKEWCLAIVQFLPLCAVVSLVVGSLNEDRPAQILRRGLRFFGGTVALIVGFSLFLFALMVVFL